MKLEIKKKVLIDVLSIANQILNKNVSMPIFNHVVFDVSKENGLNLYATNFDSSFRFYINTESVSISEEFGRFFVNCDILFKLAKTVETEKVILDYAKESYKLTVLDATNNRVATLNLIPNIDFQETYIPNPNDGVMVFKAPFFVFQRAIKQVIPFASTEDSRAILKNISLNASGDKDLLTLVATDGRRLAKIRCVTFASHDNSLLFPATSLAMLERFPGEYTEISMSNNQETAIFYLSGDDYTVLFKTRISAGSYPNWQDFFNTEYKHSIVLDKAYIMPILQRTGVITSQDRVSNTDSKKVLLSIENNQLTVTGQSLSYGSVQGTCPIEYQGDKIEFYFNPQYLSQVFTSSTAFEIKFNFNNNPLRPVEFIDDETAAHFILMPIHVAKEEV